MAAYALAVRDIVETCPEIGPIDTWQRLADRIYTPQSDPDRPARIRKQTLLRKKLSRHFTAESKGPPWQTVVLVLKHALPAELRPEKQAQLAALYEQARGEEPPTGDHPGRAEDATGAFAASAVERDLRRENHELKQQLADCMVEVSKLRADKALTSLGRGPTSDDLPRQREPLSGSPARTSNTRHFPTAQARGGGSVESQYRAPRLDTVTFGLPGQSRGESHYWVGPSRHGRQPDGGAPSNLRDHL
ncbi:hypothetical protein ACGFIE_04275 [Micromonospora sp. NPDC049275]|uniref:hypothetical protein n=1 Tax=Micromonospora sp. NPDC049275 TaxID=3364268 RepID=UPI003715E1FE